MIKNKNIVITGGAGFIGSHLLEKLLKNNNFCIIIDNFNDYYTGKEVQLKEILRDYNESRDYKLITGDLLNTSIYDKINCEIDLIFHLAAQAGVRYSIENASEVSYNNIISTVNVYEYAIKNDVEKVVYASSSSVYGNPLYTPLDEDHPKNPISPYAVSKLCGETYADLYYREYRLPVTSVRFYTVYGPRGRPDMAIRKFFDLILKDKEILIYGNGEQVRDFTYISDLINGLILVGENEQSIGEVFNLGCSSPIKINTLVKKMYSIADRTKKIKYIDKQKGDVEITHANIEKAKKMLNYNPKIEIDAGLRKTYEWQKEFKKF
ncbi:MAG: NAD-dependent epimerase/dehydratase family protein [Promethearchaeota archaeon]|nr:MAG: NAD-dependent epimerase/dehydratase family protein [Candidatus Lokiarchaeota archaeon]